jgi:hypothetical protein
MTELKTLKDIELGVYSDRCICGRPIKDHEWNFEGKSIKQPCEDTECEDFKTPYDVLKAEAVKWVKHFRKSGLPSKYTMENDFTAFFNLSEEDLK